MVVYAEYTTLKVTTLANHVLHVELHRPDKLNTMNHEFWAEVRSVFEMIERDEQTRVVILSGAGRMFTAGLDLMTAMESLSGDVGAHDGDVARAGLSIRRMGKAWQQSFTAMEQCGKPVIACVHNGVFGGGIEMISAADIRLCTSDAFFVMAEVNIGMAADVGGLQRFPRLLGNQSLVRELAFSGRKMGADEALKNGFVSRVCANKDQMMAAAMELATQIASKSPVATLGIKEFLNYSRDHSVAESLDYAITWNMGMLQGADMKVAGAALMQKSTPAFPNLPVSESSTSRSKL